MGDTRVVVTGAGGFIGHHLTRFLKAKGYYVRGVDIKSPEYEPSAADEFVIADLRSAESCQGAVDGVEEVYHLAADMGGIGYISSSHANIAFNNTAMNMNMLQASLQSGQRRFLFSSSACVYPSHLQLKSDIEGGLKEGDAWPAAPEEGYGLEKLFMEKLCQYAREDFGLETRIVRFHNVYGPLGTYDGGREKAPAAISRKIAEAEDGAAIEVWGDGKQTRSFMYIEDCVEGIYRIMRSDHVEPLNLGTDELVSVDKLVDMVAAIAGKNIAKRHELNRPQGVRGRNSDNTLLRTVLGWEPAISLADGLRPTYSWIASRVQVRTPAFDGIAA